MDKNRGRHRSSCKAGKRSIELIKKVAGVEAVIIGRSSGGKSVSRGKSDGYFKIQRSMTNGFKGVLQTSKGIQEIFLKVTEGKEENVKTEIAKLFD